MKNINVRKRTGSMDIQKELRKTERHNWFNVSIPNTTTINLSGRSSINKNSFDRKVYKTISPVLKTLKMTLFLMIPVGVVCIIISGFYTPVNAEKQIRYDNITMSNGMSKPPFRIYHQLKDECFAQEVEDKEHCIKTGLSIAYAESSWKDNHTPFGLQSSEKGYKKWVRSYKKYWHTATDGFFFYGDWGELGRSHYCVSEHSSGSDYGCPNGRKNFNKVYYNINF